MRGCPLPDFDKGGLYPSDRQNKSPVDETGDLFCVYGYLAGTLNRITRLLAESVTQTIPLASTAMPDARPKDELSVP